MSRHVFSTGTDHNGSVDTINIVYTLLSERSGEGRFMGLVWRHPLQRKLAVSKAISTSRDAENSKATKHDRRTKLHTQLAQSSR